MHWQAFSAANNALSSQEHCEAYLRVSHLFLYDALLVYFTSIII